MDPTTYLAAWLLAALLAIGAISAALTRHRQRLELRAVQAQRLLRALQRYAAWAQAQRTAVAFQGEGPDAQAALDDACAIRAAWFPELAGGMAGLLAAHNRLLQFLASQQALWLRDPENWPESDHEQRLLALWRRHQNALQALCSELEQVTHLRADEAVDLPAMAPR